MDLGGHNDSINALTGAGTVTNSTGTGTLSAGGQDTTSTFSGTFENGSGTVALTKSGTGVLTLTGASTYSGGTTIAAGTLLVDNTTGSGTGSGTVSVTNGGTLGGTGAVGGAVTVASGGNVSAGNAVGSVSTLGTLGTGDLSLGSGATLTVDLAGTSSYDVLNVTGVLTLTGATLNLLPSFTPTTVGEQYILIANDSTEALYPNIYPNTPTLKDTRGNTLVEGSLLTVNDCSYQLSFVGGSDGNDVVLTHQGLISVGFVGTTSLGNEATSPVNLTVSLSGPSTTTVTVYYAVTGGTAESGVDYTLSPGTLTFAPGVTSQTIDILIVNDGATGEIEESIIVSLSNPTNATVGANSSYTYGIQDGDSSYVTYTWDGGGADNKWTTAANWNLDIAPTGGNHQWLEFPSTASQKSNVNNFASGTAFAGLLFSGSGYSVTGNAINLDAKGLQMSAGSGTDSVSLPVAMTAASAWLVASGATLTSSGPIDTTSSGYLLTTNSLGTLNLSGVISGSGGLTNVGTGTVTLSGNNTYTGLTMLEAGTVLASSNTALGSTAAGTQVETGAKLQLSGGVTIADSLILHGTLENAAGVNTWSGAVTPAGTVLVDASTSLTISGSATGGGGLTKTGDGTLTLSGTNTYSGATTVSVGTLKLGSASALGSTVGSTTVSSGAVLDLNGQSVGDEPLVLSGSGIGSAGALTNSSSTAASLSGGVTSGGVTSSDNYAVGGTGAITLSGAIHGNLTKVGWNTLTLSGTADNTDLSITANTGTVVLDKISGPDVHAVGVLTIVGATVQLAGLYGDQICDGDDDDPLIITSGVLDLNGTNETIFSLDGSGGTILNTSSSSHSTLTVIMGGTYAGVIADGSTHKTSLIVADHNTSLTLSGTNTYTGTTQVLGGALLVNGSITSPLTTVTAPGILGGSGTIHGSVSGTGTFSPGSSPGVLTANSVGLSDGATFIVQLGGITAGTGDGHYDQLVSTPGTVTIGSNVTLSLIPWSTFTPSVGNSFTIIDNRSGTAISGTFSGLPQNTRIANFLGSGQEAQISYTGGTDSNDVVLTVIDTTSPTVTITMSDTELTAVDTALVTFTFSEPVSGFTSDDITAESGTLSPLQVDVNDNRIYTATFTPAPSTEVPTNVISVGTGYTDLAGPPGNTGTAGYSPSYSVSTMPRVKTVTVTPSDESTAVTEGVGTDTYTLVLDFAPSDTVTITATPDDQLDLGSGAGVAITKTFTTSDWNVPQTVTVAAVDDQVVEAPHTGTITHTASGGGYDTAAISGVTATITDNDTATVSIAKTTDGAEPSTSGVFTLTQTAASSTNTVISYTVGGTATSANDYTALSGSVTILAGQTTATITVPVLDDQIVEPTETVSVTLGSITSGTTGVTLDSVTENKTAELNITDDSTPTVTVTASDGSTGVTESGTTDTYTLVLDKQPSGTVTITVSADAQLQVSKDDSTFASSVQLTFTTSDWATPQTVTVQAVNDAVVEGTHSGTITHTASGGAYDSAMIASVTATITDNDTATVSIVKTTDGAEPSTNGLFTVTQTAASATSTVISYTVGGTATAGSDYTALTGSVTIPAGQTTATITVPVLDDQIVEPTEIVSVTLSSISGGTTGVTLASSPNNTASLDITDNDVPSVTVSKTTAAVAEGGATDSYTVVLDKQPSGTVTITVSADGQLQVSQDGGSTLAGSVQLTFTPNNWAAPQTVTVQAVDDLAVEGTRSRTITHSASGGAYTGTSIASVTATITDNDTVTSATYTAPANNSVPSVRVVLTGANLEIRTVSGDTLLAARAIAGLSGGLVIEGADGQSDTLTIDFGVGGAGNPIPSGGITFHGGTGGNDTLIVTRGTFSNAVYDATSAGSGRLTLDGAIVNFTGLEPTDFTTSTLDTYTINVDPDSLISGTVTTTVAASGANTLVSFTNSLESTLIGLITGTLTINGDNTDGDVFNVQSVGSSFAAALTIDGRGGTDAIHLQTGAGLTLGASKNLSLTAETIDQTGPVTVPATTTLAAGAGNNITLDNSANDFGTVAITSGRAVTLVDTNGIVLGTSSVSGALSVTARDNITQSGAVTASGGASTFTIHTGTTKDVLLGTQANDFGAQTVTITTANSGSVRDVSLRNTSASAVSPTLPSGLRNLTLQYDGAPIGTAETPLALSLATAGTLTAAASGGIYVSNTGSLIVIGGLNAGSGTISLAGGTFSLGGAGRIADLSTLSVASEATFKLNSFSETIGGLSGAGSVVNDSTTAATLTVAQAGDTTFSGVLGGSDANQKNLALVKSGDGTLTLSHANTYTGTTTISGGVLAVTADNALGTNAAGTTVGAGILRFEGLVAYLTAEAVTINNLAGVIESTTGDVSFAGAITLSTAGTIRAKTSGTLTLGGTVGGGTQNLTVDGAGNVTFVDAVGSNGTRLGTVVLTATTGTIQFSDNLYATGLTNAGGSCAVKLLGSTTEVTDPVTFGTSGKVTFGNGSGIRTFTGGVTHTAGPNEINGDIVASGGAIDLSVAVATVTGNSTLAAGSGQITLGNTTLSDNVTLTLGSAGSGGVTVASLAGTSDGQPSHVQFNVSGVVSVPGSVATDIGTVTVTNSGEATFGGPVGTLESPIGRLELTATARTILFSKDLYATDVEALGGNFAINLYGAITNVTSAVTFMTSGTLRFGDGGATTDELTFTGGVTHTTGANVINGNISSTMIRLNDTAILPKITTTVLGNSQLTAGSDGISLADTTLSNNVTLILETGGSGSGDVTVASLVGTAGDGASHVTFNVTGTVSVTGTVGTDIGTLTVTNSASTTFTGAVGETLDPIDAVVLTATTGTIQFSDKLYATGLTQAEAAGTVTFVNDITLGADGGTFAANVVLDGLLLTSAGDVTFGSSTANQDSLELSGGAVSLVVTGRLHVNSQTVGTSLNNKMTLTSSDNDVTISGSVTSDGGEIEVNADTGVTLDDAASAIISFTAIAFGGQGIAGLIDINADTDGDGSGVFTMNAAGRLSSNAADTDARIEIDAGDFTVSAGTIDAGSSVVHVGPTRGKGISLGGGVVVGTFGMSGAEVDRITSNRVEIGYREEVAEHVVSGAVTIDGDVIRSDTSGLVISSGEAINADAAGRTVGAVTLAFNAVNGVGSTQIFHVETDILAANSTGAGAIVINELTDVTVGTITTDESDVIGITTADGNIALSTTAGSITVDQAVTVGGSGRNVILDAQGATKDVVLHVSVIMVGGQVDIRSGRDITQVAADDYVIASKVTLVAGGSVGGAIAATAIDTRATIIAAAAGTNVYINQDTAGGDLTIGTVTSLITGAIAGVSTTAGHIDVRTENGTLTVSSTVAAGTAGNVNLVSPETAIITNHVVVNATVTAVGGAIAISAGDNLTVGTSAHIHAHGHLTISVDAGSTDVAGGTANLYGELASDVTDADAIQVNGGPENDTISIDSDGDGTGTVLNVLSRITIAGAGGIDSLTLGDRGETDATAVTLDNFTATGGRIGAGASDSFFISAAGDVYLTYTGLENVTLNMGSASDTIDLSEYHQHGATTNFTVGGGAISGGIIDTIVLNFASVAGPIVIAATQAGSASATGFGLVAWTSIEDFSHIHGLSEPELTTGDLCVQGTIGNDVITFTEVGLDIANTFTVKVGTTVYPSSGTYGSIGTLIAWAGAGNDRVAVTSATTTTNNCEFHGEAGNDNLSGTGGVANVDLIDGGIGDDAVYGLGGNDMLIGGAGADLIDGGDGNDTIDGGAGNDTIYTGAGNDVARGGPDADVLYSQLGNDVLLGEGGNDILYGGTGRSLLIGGDGADYLYGAAGDIMIAAATPFDSQSLAHDTALKAIVTAWKGVSDNTTALTARGVVLGSQDTDGHDFVVVPDTARDYLFGSTGTKIDWFLYATTGTLDSLSRLGSEDLKNSAA
ncbi:MAG: autotransporter-associated beta strand repeat-containing protein [Planctomycetota bacterium]|nr:autotransporter-associated beta strand repeat-containing protein [Planctomycetota bacterium]